MPSKSNIILPEDPDFDQPIVMGDAYDKTPKITAQRNAEEHDSNENFKYAASVAAHAPDAWTKTAQQTGVDNMMTNPMWFSPLHTPQNWQIASKRREVYQWNRFWYENEPKVAAAIDFYARFPMNGFTLECENRKVLSFFKHHVVKKLGLNERFKEISSENYMLGDAFIHTDIDCPVCAGSAIDPDSGEECNHPGGMFRRIFIMNPDWIEVQKSPLTDEPLIVLIPDEELQQIVHKRQPKAIYDRIPEKLKPLILARAPIPLSNRTISHMRHMPVPYGTYGTSIIRRLFTTLAYKTKIMTANWIVAERLILPVRVVKIGSDNRPASSTDIQDIQQQLAQTANDPNLTIVTHHNFEYEWYGTQGKILQVTQEMEHIDKEILDGLMLNQALLNGEMGGYNCYDEETEVLTDDGFKKYYEVNNEDKIATLYIQDENNVYTNNKIVYTKPQERQVYDYDGELIHFCGKQMDVMVTPNHRMLTRSGQNGEWEVKFADQVRPGMRFLSHAKYEHSDKFSSVMNIDKGINVDMRRYFEYAGYYLSEGSMSCKKTNYQVSISQSDKSPVLDKMVSCMNGLGMKYSDYSYTDRDVHSLTICNKSFVKHLKRSFGSHADNKHIPNWMKNAPVEYLNILIQALVDGDGQTIEHKNTTNYVYTTISEHLADDVQEISFKAGFNVRKVAHTDASKAEDSKSRILFRVKLSKGKWSKGNEPRIKEYHIKRSQYKGKVWCFTVPSGFFVTRRNGKIAIQGNSAQVGVETLIRRIESWRHSLAEWAEEKIFKPISEMQGFIDEKESKELGETVFQIPKIKWNDLELKDKTQHHQMLMQLHDKQVISTQTLLDEIGLDYDIEVKRMRYEQAQMGPAGAQLGQGAGGAGGDMMGGMPGGAASPMGAGGDMGGGMGGDMGGVGGMGAGGDMGGGGGSMAPAAGAGGGKVLKKGKSGKSSEGEETPIPMIPIKLTKIEQQMAGMLEEIASNMSFNPQEIRMQYPFENPKGGKGFSMDFAIPSLKLDIEADGEIWHSSAEQTNDDQERDNLLAQRGWTVLRFDDKTIEDAPQDVKSTINSYIQSAMAGPQKHASTQNGDKDSLVHCFMKTSDGLKEFKPDTYYELRDEIYPSKREVFRSEMIGQRSREEYFADAKKI